MFLPLSPFRAVALISAILFNGSGLCAAAEITSDLIVTGLLGSPFQYQITADNQPTSFDATGLPPGLSLDQTTGLVSGVPSISGHRYVDLAAHGQSGSAVATCSFFVYSPIPADDPILGGFNVVCNRMLADPNRPRIYCSGSNQELVVIDTDAMSVVTTIPNTGYVGDLSISADGRTLWMVRTTQTPLARVNLDTLDGFTVVPTSEGLLDSVREGLGNRLYAATYGHEVLQLDQTTGAVQQRFHAGVASPADGLSLAISPDRRTLYVSDAFYDGTLVTRSAVSRYDIATAVPTFLQRVVMPAHRVQDLVAAPGDDSIYAVLGTLDGDGSTAIHRTLCLSGLDLTTRGAFSYPGTATVSVTITADGTKALQSIILGNGSSTTGLVKIFDTRSFQLLETVTLGTRNAIGLGNVYVSDAVFDQAGLRMFVATDLSPPVRVYDMTPSPPPVTPPKSLLNISTRMMTRTGDSVLIGGFIVAGNDPKQVILRGVGPSLSILGQLGDPALELHGGAGELIAENDNWNSHRSEVLATGIPPPNEREAAIVATLQPGAYTVILRGSYGTVGIAAVEVYDLNPLANSRLANISTRGNVETGDKVMIGGWIIGGNESTNVAVRAIAPSLGMSGVPGTLSDPTLNVHNGHGVLLAQNDDWRADQEEALINAGLAPVDNRESAILLSLTPGNYTAIVRGKNDTTGVALVEVYNLQQGVAPDAADDSAP